MTTFLNGELDEEIYTDQLEGFVVPGQEGKVCKLVRSLYGLKQAPKQWHQKFDNALLSYGFTVCMSDKCLYWKLLNDSYVILCLYVDDILIFGNEVVRLRRLKISLTRILKWKTWVLQRWFWD